MKLSPWARSLLQRVAPALPGLLLFVVLWLITIRRLAFSLLVEENYGYMQFLGRDVLVNEPLRALRDLHMQPPLLNALAALDLWWTPESHLLLAGTQLLLMLIVHVLVVDALYLLNLSVKIRLVAGVLLAALPASVVYSLWSYNTTLTLFGVTVAVWGSLLLRSRPFLGLSTASFGALILVLTRASFLWIFALLWLAWQTTSVWQRLRFRGRVVIQLLPLIVFSLSIVGIQAHYVVRFDLLSMSSWSGENVLKALHQSGALKDPSIVSQGLAVGSCQHSLTLSLLSDEPPLWDPVAFRALPGCDVLPRLPNRGSAAWDEQFRNTRLERLVNLNWSDELVAAREWESVMRRFLIADPFQPIRMALVSPRGPRHSGMGIYLGSAEAYFEVEAIRRHHPLADVGRLVSLPFATASILIGSIGGFLRALRIRRRKEIEVCSGQLRFVWALVTYQIAVSVLAEYGEGMRFQAEIVPVLLILLVVGGHSIVSNANTSGRMPYY